MHAAARRDGEPALRDVEVVVPSGEMKLHVGEIAWRAGKMGWVMVEVARDVGNLGLVMGKISWGAKGTGGPGRCIKLLAGSGSVKQRLSEWPLVRRKSLTRCDMAVLPKTINEQLAFSESHVQAWIAHASQLGLDESRVAVFAEQVAATRAAYDAAQAARAAAEAATTRLYGEARTLAAQAALFIREIKTTAAASDEPADILALGRIPARADNSPKGAPGKATNIEIDLVGTGAVKLSWSARNASASSGAFFDVLRKLPGETSFTSIGACEGTTARTRTITFIDDTLPAHAAAQGVRYIIVPRRGASKGEPSEAIAVQVGVREREVQAKLAA
jgi:hypothetical protein